MEIVIGYQGKNHVTAGQVGRIMAGMAGSGTYVLETQNRLAATVVTANQVRVDTGDLVMQGRVATVETPETLTIESGVTGQKRRDLIVARYTMEDSTAVEGIELAVVKGTPVSYGEPSDPEVSEGSILDGDSPVEVPLYRVTVDGLTPGTPEALLDTVPSVDSLRDSVSQPSEWTQLATGCWYAVKAGWCCVSCEGLPLTKGQQRLVCRLPVGAPAGHNVVCPLIGYDSSGGPWAGTVAHLTVNAAGNVFGWTNGATGSYQGTVCFPVG